MGKKVLVADDDPSVRFLLSAVLAGEDYDLSMARDGQEAIDLALQQRPDIILLDVNMPKLNGMEACARLKSMPGLGNVRILLLTALAQDTDRARGQASGADAYISKPFSPTMLVAKIEEFLSAGPQVPSVHPGAQRQPVTE